MIQRALKVIAQKCVFMNSQLELTLKDHGISEALEDKDYWLHKARSIAYQIAQEKGSVSVDDIYKVCPLPPGNWKGGIFREKGKWRKVTGVPATHKGSHAREIKVWEIAA